MRIVVLGATGMLGHKVFQRMGRVFPDTWATTRVDTGEAPYATAGLLQGDKVIRNVNVEDFDRLKSLLADLRPNCIVNCIGVVKQRDESRMPIPSILVNALFPHRLAQVAATWGGHVIQPSTDCVFSGRRGGYTEADVPDAEDLYGRTKALGEMATTENALTLRKSLIGPELVSSKALLGWFLAQRGRTIRGFTGAVFSGVTTSLFADVLIRILDERPGLSGLYHLAGPPISKYELLLLLREEFKLEVEILPDDTEVCDRSLSGAKLRAEIRLEIPSWREMVRSLAAECEGDRVTLYPWFPSIHSRQEEELPFDRPSW